MNNPFKQLFSPHAKMRRLGVTHYARIYTVAKGVAKAWKTERIPTKTVFEIIDRAMMKHQNDELDDFRKHFNNTLASLKVEVQKQAKRTLNDKKITLDELKQLVGALQEGFVIFVNNLKFENDGDNM